MSLTLRSLAEGKAATVLALAERQGGSGSPSPFHAKLRTPPRIHCPVADFLADQARRDPKELARLVQLIDYAAEHGPPRNLQKCRELTGTDGLFEFKTQGGLRLFWFWDVGRMVICTHGTLKKSPKTPPGEIQRATLWRRKYFQAKQQQGAVPRENAQH